VEYTAVGAFSFHILARACEEDPAPRGFQLVFVTGRVLSRLQVPSWIVLWEGPTPVRSVWACP
jgi:hypothetical protein